MLEDYFHMISNFKFCFLISKFHNWRSSLYFKMSGIQECGIRCWKINPFGCRCWWASCCWTALPVEIKIGARTATGKGKRKWKTPRKESWHLLYPNSYLMVMVGTRNSGWSSIDYEIKHDEPRNRIQYE